MFVIKRDGRKETLNIEQIRKQIIPACEGLEGTDYEELEQDAHITFNDGIKTSDIQKTLIKTAETKIDIDRPNWTFVAARLFLYDLYHKVSGYTGYVHLKDYFERGEKANKILRGFKEIFDLEYLNSLIDPTRDLQFNYLGIKTLYDRYLLKDKFDPIELPQHMFMAIAMFLAHKEKDPNYWAAKFYDILSKFEVMVATPTLSNARTTRHQLSSCYIGSTPDNIEGIFDSYKEMALLSKYGGGIGWDFSKVRCTGSDIENFKGVAGGIIPFLKIANDVAVAVDQTGVRKGAIAVYLEVWHKDINDFVDLRKNSGDERRRGHDLFPAVWICDLFMERVLNNSYWTLFDPYECSELTELYGEEFNKRYVELEMDESINKQSILAKDLWKRILTNYFEAGLPFLCFKDNANRANPNPHIGIIRSSNLCTEIFQNTEPSEYEVEVKFKDGSKIYYKQNEEIRLDNGDIKHANRLTTINSIGGKEIFATTKVRKDGKTAVCNLASVNLSKVNKKEDIERVVPIAIRMLDNVIDLNFYPDEKIRITNMANRAIGLGIMGEAEMLATQQIEWGSSKHFYKIDEIMELISYNAIKASSVLAKEKGAYPEFDGSNWSKGILPIDVASTESRKLIHRQEVYDWDSLREYVMYYGMRNGYLMSIAPTTSISILTGTTQTIEPVYKKKWLEENMSGMIPNVVPNLNLETYNYYISAYDLDQTLLVKAGAIRQKWIDQGQSLNIFMDIDKVKDAGGAKMISDLYITAWKLGLKSTYYLRSLSPDAEKESMQGPDRSIECYNCQ